MLKAKWKKYSLQFKIPAGTSRGILHTKDTWLISLWDSDNSDKKGVGECNMFKGLSFDDCADYEEKLTEVCESINTLKYSFHDRLQMWPSIRFGLEMAFISLQSQNPNILFPSSFTNAKDEILINGLVWMGDYLFMKEQVINKIEAGFNCIKIKIGAINFEDELALIKLIRKDFPEKDMEIRVDANGAFTPDGALEKLKRLSDYGLHSIEQPIKQGQGDEMAMLCEKSPLPIALDEELIGVLDYDSKKNLIKMINPQYIILKPSLTGGFKASEEWIAIAEDHNIKWWVTSALESNIGLNAIAQWTYTLDNKMPQGLGTGTLFSNNFESPLYINNGNLCFKV